jgi:hypothetical protein
MQADKLQFTAAAEAAAAAIATANTDTFVVDYLVTYYCQNIKNISLQKLL